jgi:hypothetical protein
MIVVGTKLVNVRPGTKNESFCYKLHPPISTSGGHFVCHMNRVG